MKKIIATLAATAAVITAAPANASANWICDALDNSPTSGTVIAIVQELIHEGYTADNGGPELMAQAIVYGCPEYFGLVQDTANSVGSRAA